MTILFAVALLAGCQSPRPCESEVLANLVMGSPTDRIETPRELPSSNLLGLTEAEILQKGQDRLSPEPGAPDKKWFSGGVISPASAHDGYEWSRINILTFAEGTVVKHEIVDRITAHMTIVPSEEMR